MTLAGDLASERNFRWETIIFNFIPVPKRPAPSAAPSRVESSRVAVRNGNNSLRTDHLRRKYPADPGLSTLGRWGGAWSNTPSTRVFEPKLPLRRATRCVAGSSAIKAGLRGVWRHRATRTDATPPRRGRRLSLFAPAAVKGRRDASIYGRDAENIQFPKRSNLALGGPAASGAHARGIKVA